MTKKIHVITKYFYPVVAGIELNIHETYARLAKMGWDVTIHTSNGTYLKKNYLPEIEIISGLKVKRYPLKWYGIFPRIDWQEESLIALHNFDIFPHFFILAYAFILKLIGKKRFKIALTPHGGYNPEWSIYSKAQRLIKKTYTYTLGTWLINHTVDGIRAVSNWEKAEMIKRGLNPQKVQTIANGLEDEAYDRDDKKVSAEIKSKVKSWGRYIFDDARIYTIKNQEVIIKALPLIPKDINFVNIGMVGNQQYHDSLMKLAREAGVEKRVIFPGIVRGSDKYFLNRRALAFVHMAKWESFCNVVHQAISQGLVCLVANNTALPYLVKDGINGFLIPTFDHVALAEKINYVLSPKNAKEMKRIRDYNLKHGLENSWNNVAKKANELYQSLFV